MTIIDNTVSGVSECHDGTVKNPLLNRTVKNNTVVAVVYRSYSLNNFYSTATVTVVVQYCYVGTSSF